MNKIIRQEYLMNASPAEVFQALTDPKIIRRWSGAPAKMSAETGAEFSLWGGDMFGTNLEVVENNLLVQEWCTRRFKSKVTFTIEAAGRKSRVSLVHEDVPEDEFDDYADGWENFYLGPMRTMFEK